MKTDDEGTQRLQAARKRKEAPEDEESTYPARKAVHPREVEESMERGEATPDQDAASVSGEEAGSTAPGNTTRTSKAIQKERSQKRGAETKVED